jgi:3-hydroxyisobutyrate dehydrogenase
MDPAIMTQVAFIGLGAMGGGMAAHLAKKGLVVRAFDLNEKAVEKSQAAGCIGSNSVQDAVRDADFVVTMLPAGSHVRAVYAGEGGVFDHCRPDSLLLDSSTISVDDARFLIHEASTRGLEMCDAPVSGGVAAAANGTLTFMVGGTRAAFQRGEPLLAQMGKAVIRAGDAGAGQAAKICNNMLLAVTMIGTCEAFLLAEQLGLDAQSFFDIASKSSGQNWSMTSYAPVAGLVASAPSNRDFADGFAGGLMLKDVRLALEAASSCNLTASMALKAEEIYSKYVSNYSSERDFSGIIDMLRKE